MDLDKEYANCLNSIMASLSDENDFSLKSKCPFNKFNEVYLSDKRINAIQKGLSFIYKVSKDESVFNTFGNDIIQCFYDISRVTVFARTNM